MKVCIWKHYLAHVILYLKANVAQNGVLVMIEKKLSKCIEHWLYLPACFTWGSMFHHKVLSLRFVPYLRDQAKLGRVTTTELSVDKYVKKNTLQLHS